MSTFKSLEDRLTGLQNQLASTAKQCNELIKEIEGIKHSTVEEKIIWLRGQGMSFSAIAESIGLSRTTVFKKAKQLGLMGEKDDVEQ